MNTNVPPPRPRILVVDDFELNRDLLAEQLLLAGYDVVEADGGRAALDAVEADPCIDLVLLDIMMPKPDGIEVCRQIKQERGRLDLPVVFVTALDDHDSRVRGKEVGGDDFLSKPFDRVELMARVRNLLQVRAYHQLRDRQRERLEEELERMREQLLRADRLATLGTLAAGVGHELNNIAGVLKSTLYFVRERAGAGLPPESEDVERLERTLDHLVTHARHLLEYGRPGPAGEEALDLREVVDGTLDMLRVAGRTKHVTVACDVPSRPVALTANRARLEQILVNLVGNAADAVAELGADRRRVAVRLAAPPGGPVVLEIEDTGCGIPDELRAAIFEPYFTTKPAGQGTGLGLPVVRQIVEGYGGALTVESTLGAGSCFRVTLPSAGGA
jgi:C4-dicarboxylate-specific signal transduction histidine kinase